MSTPRQLQRSRARLFRSAGWVREKGSWGESWCYVAERDFQGFRTVWYQATWYPAVKNFRVFRAEKQPFAFRGPPSLEFVGRFLSGEEVMGAVQADIVLREFGEVE